MKIAKRRIRRLEARSEIADERRVTAQSNLTEVEHRLHEIEGRVGDVENLSSPTDDTQGKLTSHEATNGTGHNQSRRADSTIIVRLPANPQ
ncbi:MAG TPA: hypothetical protein VE398_17995 [Acidobacteriota bacterium]|nr:hypothetical protein [Acidobacteriota bacterium]